MGTRSYPERIQETKGVQLCSQTEPNRSSGYAKRSLNGDSDSLRTQNRSHRFEWVRAFSCTCSQLATKPPPESGILLLRSFFLHLLVRVLSFKFCSEHELRLTAIDTITTLQSHARGTSPSRRRPPESSNLGLAGQTVASAHPARSRAHIQQPPTISGSHGKSNLGASNDPASSLWMKNLLKPCIPIKLKNMKTIGNVQRATRT